MKLCVQAIYIYFPFLIPQRYIRVKKKALSGNVIKLSKSAHTKKKPISTFRGGHFLCFRYVDCLCLLRGQDNDLSLVNGVGVHKTVGVALEDGLVLHQIKIRTAQIFHLLLAVISNRQNRRKALKSLGLLRNQNHPELSSFIRCYP